MNLAHIKCRSMLLGTLCTVQPVCLSKLAAAFYNRASSESSFRCFQRFLDGTGLGCRGRIPEVSYPVRRTIHSHDGPHELEVRRCEYQCVSTGHSVWTPAQTRELQLQGANQHHGAVHPIVRT